MYFLSYHFIYDILYVYRIAYVRRMTMKTMIAALGLLLVLASCQTTPIPVPEDKSSEWEAREALTRDRDSLLAKTGQLEFQILGLKATLKVNEGLLAQYQEQLKVLSDDLSVMARLKEGSRAQAESALASALMESESLKAEIAQLKQERNRLSQQLVEEAQRIAAAADQLRKTLKAGIDRGNLEVVQFESILIVNINDSLLFAPDSPLLKDQYKPILFRHVSAVQVRRRCGNGYNKQRVLCPIGLLVLNTPCMERLLHTEWSLRLNY